MLDVLVIGGGLAGMAAALAAAEAGCKTRLAAEGGGSLLVGAGTIDLWGGSDPAAPFPGNPLEALSDLPAGHPYGLVGAAAVAEAAGRLQAICQSAGYPLLGREDGTNWLLPTPIGTVRPAWLVPAAMAAGDVRAGGETLLVGFSELKDFYPRLMADNLNRLAGYGGRCRPLQVSLGLPDDRDLTPVQIAAALEQPKTLAALAAAIRPHLGQATRVGFPAVLGFAAHGRVMAELTGALGVSVFEFAILPPSVPGARLNQILLDALQAAGVQLALNASVAGVEVEEDRVLAAVVRGPGRPLRLTARQFVLASGGIYGGGLVGEGQRLRETVFDLPVWQPAEWTLPRAYGAGEQPYQRAGLVTDGELRPGPYRNLRAAGRLLAHQNPQRELSGVGVALATGYRAGRLAAGAVAPSPLVGVAGGER